MTELKEKSLEIIHLDEPLLGFGHGQQCDHPKDGLFLYGPNGALPQARFITVGVIGTADGLKFFRNTMERIKGRIDVPPPGKLEKEVRLHLSNFPGLQEAFGLCLDPRGLVECEISLKSLDDATRALNHHEAVSKAVDLYISAIENYDRNEERKIEVWAFILPELIFERCKVGSLRSGLPLVKGEFGKKQKAKASLPLLEPVIDQASEDIFDDVPDFHRQVKARLLKLGHTSQLLRETTLAPEAFVNKAGYPVRKLQEPATVAWNIATGLYYKTQPEPPWKLANVRPGVCYLGFVYKLLPNHRENHACCAAQMFLNEGDGIVFRGANGPWRTADREFHLKADEAKKLIATVLSTFHDKHKTHPRELFIHGRTRFNDEEWAAFAEAVPQGTNLVGVRIKTTDGDTKLFREGDYPVLRGTALLLDEANAYLWTNGFLPRLDTYIGPETPNPLFVTIMRSTGPAPDLRTVLTDIMGLTKINYNACNFSDGLPVTVRFADKVGDVLTMGAAQGAERQPFKFYV
ncbi:hypothetical protein RHECNPAF_1780018 [Rhizobium etli CNPAF512]|nr:hypothetical protein RHECNPAF_1780018 [Rhizobium etli CNPAF512]